MKRMHWQRLDRDTSVKVIDSVKSEANAGLFSVGTSEVQRSRLTFYKDYSVYKVTNFASLPSFSFEYLSDGIFFHYLDGTEEPIHGVNDKNVLTLSAGNVLEYLTFYFAHVGDDEGDVIVITNPHDMPMLDSLDPHSYDAVFAQYKPSVITEDKGNFSIETDLYQDSQMVRAVIDVNHKGRVSIKGQKMTMNEVEENDFMDNIQ